MIGNVRGRAGLDVLVCEQYPDWQEAIRVFFGAESPVVAGATSMSEPTMQSPFLDPPCGCGLTPEQWANELATIEYDAEQRGEALKIRAENEHKAELRRERGKGTL